MAICEASPPTSACRHRFAAWLDKHFEVLFLGVLSIVPVVILVGFGVHADIHNGKPSVRAVGMIGPQLGEDAGTCYAEMVEGTFEPLTLGGKSISRYHRSPTWWASQCPEGALIDVTHAMIRAAQEEAALRQQWQAEYERLQGR